MGRAQRTAEGFASVLGRRRGLSPEQEATRTSDPIAAAIDRLPPASLTEDDLRVLRLLQGLPSGDEQGREGWAAYQLGMRSGEDNHYRIARRLSKLKRLGLVQDRPSDKHGARRWRLATDSPWREWPSH